MNIFVNASGDIELDLTTNNLKMVSGVEEISQSISANLETISGGWFLDTTIGAPWFSDILQKNVSLNKIDGVIMETIIRSDGVVSLLSYSSILDKASRTLTIEFTAETVAGILNFNQTTLLT